MRLTRRGFLKLTGGLTAAAGSGLLVPSWAQATPVAPIDPEALSPRPFQIAVPANYGEWVKLNDVLRVDDEIMRVVGVDSSGMAIVRGTDGTVIGQGIVNHIRYDPMLPGAKKIVSKVVAQRGPTRSPAFLSVGVHRAGFGDIMVYERRPIDSYDAFVARPGFVVEEGDVLFARVEGDGATAHVEGTDLTTMRHFRAEGSQMPRPDLSNLREDDYRRTWIDPADGEDMLEVTPEELDVLTGADGTVEADVAAFFAGGKLWEEQQKQRAARWERAMQMSEEEYAVKAAALELDILKV